MKKYSQLTKPVLVDGRAKAALKFAEDIDLEQKIESEKKLNTDTKSTYAPEGYRRLTINLPISLHKKLKMKAVEQNTTATEIIEKFLNSDMK
jgi:hypothetical protein